MKTTTYLEIGDLGYELTVEHCSILDGEIAHGAIVTVHGAIVTVHGADAGTEVITLDTFELTYAQARNVDIVTARRMIDDESLGEIVATLD